MDIRLKKKGKKTADYITDAQRERIIKVVGVYLRAYVGVATSNKINRLCVFLWRAYPLKF